ncbi:HAD family phosphatase [Planktothrix sp. FACHB-1355]|uniref:HAD family phosphatase n=1 Tax=Aerosakkonema funiforme FACHB-1375 TaxID=2949571 RepID=A0A926VIM7_9CYAN|nr:MULTISPECIES: HAD family phosphatase [Oscillatoriales]MBD2184350.1 HAD family phosphatase [Aerosakkonema funiforme FACHB-1375]MBD3560782.1 HAD family phosphatase [Planktothrix sp. FACHB-1355]
MTLKAVLFDFNGVIINDEAIHEKLIGQILIDENLRPKPGEYREICLGRSDRACLSDILSRRGRVVTENYLTQLLTRKAEAYRQELEKLEKLPIYPGLEDLIYKLRVAKIKMAVVSGALRAEVELVLNRANLAQNFELIVAGDDLTASKPEPDSYLLAVERLNQKFPDFNLKPSECLAIEDTFAGITAAKSAGIQVVGVANTYPFHMLQRQANWTVDFLTHLELERVQELFSRKAPQTTAS